MNPLPTSLKLYGERVIWGVLQFRELSPEFRGTYCGYPQNKLFMTIKHSDGDGIGAVFCWVYICLWSYYFLFYKTSSKDCLLLLWNKDDIYVMFLCFCMMFKSRHVAKGEEGGRGEDSTHAWLKWVKFALNRKHALFDAML